MAKDKSYKIHGTTLDSSIDMPDSMDLYDKYGDWVDNVLVEEVDGYHSADAYKEMALEEQLEEIYETVVGDNGRERYSHGELIQWLKDLYDNRGDK
jgi:hypothetical protein